MNAVLQTLDLSEDQGQRVTEGQHQPDAIHRRIRERIHSIQKALQSPKTAKAANGMLVMTDNRPGQASITPTLDIGSKIFPAAETERETFNALAEWEGTVTSVGKETFAADLIQLQRGSDVAQTNLVTDEAELQVDDVILRDRDLLQPGGLFRLVVGYRIAPGGQRWRSMIVVFRRMPKWQRSELERAVSESTAEQSAFDVVSTDPAGDG